MSATWNDEALTQAGLVGMVFGIIVTLALTVMLLNLANYQPVPKCHEEAVIMEIADRDLVCVPKAKFYE